MKTSIQSGDRHRAGVHRADHDGDSTATNRDAVLEVSELRAGYGRVPVLHGISLKLFEGEAIGIVGHNGMGKSTLLKSIMGLMPTSAGRITIDSVDVTGTPAHIRSRLGIAYVPQGRGILPGLSSRDNLRLAWSADSGETEEQSLSRVLDTFPRLNPLLERRGGALSGGEQQILALARALMPSPWLLLLDEPSEGIQPSIVQEIGQILASLRDTTGLSMLIVEQNLDLVLDVADRIIALERGRIVREMPASEVRAGAMAELLGMGAARFTRSPGGSSSSAVQPAVTSAGHKHAHGFDPNFPRPTSSAKTLHSESHHLSNIAPSGGSMAIVKRPSLAQMKEIVASLNMSMSDHEVGEYLEVMEGTFKSYDRIAQLSDNLPPVRYPRTPGHKPKASENPLNAWYVKTDIKGAPYGPLQGKRIVLKDNVCLAGVPMMNGASTLEGYVPDIDATLVTRILDAGGTIVGKAHCEYFCFPAAVTQPTMGRYITPTRLAIPLAALPAVPERWSARAKLKWESAGIRAGQSVCLRHSPAVMA